MQIDLILLKWSRVTNHFAFFFSLKATQHSCKVTYICIQPVGQSVLDGLEARETLRETIAFSVHVTLYHSPPTPLPKKTHTCHALLQPLSPSPPKKSTPVQQIVTVHLALLAKSILIYASSFTTGRTSDLCILVWTFKHCTRCVLAIPRTDILLVWPSYLLKDINVLYIPLEPCSCL